MALIQELPQKLNFNIKLDDDNIINIINQCEELNRYSLNNKIDLNNLKIGDKLIIRDSLYYNCSVNYTPLLLVKKNKKFFYFCPMSKRTVLNCGQSNDIYYFKLKFHFNKFLYDLDDEEEQYIRLFKRSYKITNAIIKIAINNPYLKNSLLYFDDNINYFDQVDFYN